MVKFLVVEDYTNLTTTIRNIIETNFASFHIEEACDGNTVLEKVKKGNYDLTMLDVYIPNIDSATLVTDILAINPDEKILMFGMNNGETYAKKYLQLGVMGYVSKASTEPEIVMAMESVLDNKRYLRPSLLQLFAHDAFMQNHKNPFEKCSQRELEILQHMLAGETIKEISLKLEVDSSTVSTYKARIFSKLNSNSISDIAELARLYTLDQKTIF